MTGTLASFVESYTYLFCSLCMFIIFLAGIFLSPEQRRPMLFSAFLTAPFAMTSVFYEPNYWSPSRLWNLGNLGTGFEDLIYTFAGGGIVWLTTSFFLQNRINFSTEKNTRWSRYFWCFLYVFSATAISWFMGFGIMAATLIILFSWGLFLIVVQKGLWRIAIWNSIVFLVIHSLSLKVIYIFWPHFVRQWNLSNISGFIWGLPIEELAWALGMGFTWPLFMAYVLDVQVRFDGSALD